jgi:hypothetical protein
MALKKEKRAKQEILCEFTRIFSPMNNKERYPLNDLHTYLLMTRREARETREKRNAPLCNLQHNPGRH